MDRPKQHGTALKPADRMEQRVRTTPVSHSRTLRYDDVSVLTSGYGGKLLPVAMVPLLREDSVLNSTIAVNFQMAETAEMLVNPVRATAYAYLVPKLALDRFSGFDAINRSYNGQQEIDGSTIPWFDQVQAGDPPNELYQKLGLHVPQDGLVNSDVVESYTAVFNHMAKQASLDVPETGYRNPAVQPAFWEHTQMRHVKASFDDAMMDGAVPLSFVGQTDQLRVKSKERSSFGESAALGQAPTGSAAFTPPYDQDGYDWAGEIWAEMTANSVQVSLANIDLARETAAWARLRTQYQGLDEDWMMDQLLSGVRIPEEGMKHPILLDKQSVPFGMSQRYATDGGNLDKSVTDGRTALQLRLRTPPVNTGGMIVIVASCLPEMIFERTKDHYFFAKNVSELPNRTSDELDPQPVDIVSNGDVDTAHGLPDDIFGYEPLNAKWMRNTPRIGGKYYRADPFAAWSEDRNRIWDTNVVNPALGDDFYLARNLKHDVFADKNTDSFEIWAGGRVRIEGLTYFGPSLLESTDDYQKVLDQVDLDRVDPDQTP